MSLPRAFGSLLFIAISFLAIRAQDDDPIRVDSSIVRLNVGVVDARGKSITTLNRDSFDLYEDGVKQQITRFEPSDAPFSVVIMLDMSGSTLSFRQVITQSAIRFIDALSPNDRVAVIEFYDKINLRNDFTTDRSTIYHSIAVSNGRGKTHFYKALDFALDKLASEKSHRKAIIVLSDGVDTELQDVDRQALERVKDDQVATALKPEASDALNRVLTRSDAQGVTIYPLFLPTGDPSRLIDPTPRQTAMYLASKKRVEMIAERTGGELNAINRLEDMGRLYAQIAAQLQTLYTVEYTPLDAKRDGKWRAIKIGVKNSDYIARTRPGYYAK
jgi:VWFA-related protein